MPKFFCILKMQENKRGDRTKAGRLYDKTGNVRINKTGNVRINKTGNVRINVTLRHDLATIVAVANQ
jgi:hypothetical protein